jgi:hypothetical protein
MLFAPTRVASRAVYLIRGGEIVLSLSLRYRRGTLLYVGTSVKSFLGRVPFKGGVDPEAN